MDIHVEHKWYAKFQQHHCHQRWWAAVEHVTELKVPSIIYQRNVSVASVELKSKVNGPKITQNNFLNQLNLPIKSAHASCFAFFFDGPEPMTDIPNASTLQANILSFVSCGILSS